MSAIRTNALQESEVWTSLVDIKRQTSHIPAMISLHTRQFPSSKNELAQALENAIRRFAQKTGPIVTVRSANFPHFDEITVNLDGVHLDSSFPAPPRIAGKTEPACAASVVTLSARNVSVRGVPMELRMEAHDAVFYKGQDENGEVVLIFGGARDGTGGRIEYRLLARVRGHHVLAADEVADGGLGREGGRVRLHVVLQ